MSTPPPDGSNALSPPTFTFGHQFLVVLRVTDYTLPLSYRRQLGRETHRFSTYIAQKGLKPPTRHSATRNAHLQQPSRPIAPVK